MVDKLIKYVENLRENVESGWIVNSLTYGELFLYNKPYERRERGLLDFVVYSF